MVSFVIVLISSLPDIYPESWNSPIPGGSTTVLGKCGAYRCLQRETTLLGVCR